MDLIFGLIKSVIISHYVFLSQLFLAFLCIFGSQLIDMIELIKIFQSIIAVLTG